MGQNLSAVLCGPSTATNDDTLADGIPEPEVNYEANTSLDKKWNCRKRDRHSEFIPVQEFDVKKHVPERYRDPRCQQLVQAMSDLTVMLKFKNVSADRPEYMYGSKNSSYPLHMFAGKEKEWTGTGYVTKVEKRGDKWELDILTCQHVLFDTSEIEGSEVMLYFDSGKESQVPESCRTPISHIFYTNLKLDLCECSAWVEDDGVGNRLLEATMVYEGLSERHDDYRTYSDDLVIVVSHPHGCAKHVSVGERKDFHIFKTIEYTTLTCPGSSGGFVWLGAMFYRSPSRAWAWTHYHHSMGLGNGTNMAKFNFPGGNIDFCIHENRM